MKFTFYCCILTKKQILFWSSNKDDNTKTIQGLKWMKSKKAKGLLLLFCEKGSNFSVEAGFYCGYKRDSFVFKVELVAKMEVQKKKKCLTGRHPVSHQQLAQEQQRHYLTVNIHGSLEHQIMENKDM